MSTDSKTVFAAAAAAAKNCPMLNLISKTKIETNGGDFYMFFMFELI